MKTLYLAIALLLASTGLYAQRAEIPNIAASTNIDKSNASYHSQASDDSLFSTIRIVPNLAAGRITLMVNDANPNVIQQGECVIYDNGGKPVAKNPFTTGTTQIYVNKLPAGIFYVRLIQKNGQEATKKFVVVR